MSKKYTLILVPETHWDREWYSTFQEFRIRLVRLTDKLLDILDKDPDYKSFTFDGQTVVLEDYLEIRPQERERIEKHVERRPAAGRAVVYPAGRVPGERRGDGPQPDDRAQDRRGVRPDDESRLYPRPVRPHLAASADSRGLRDPQRLLHARDGRRGRRDELRVLVGSARRHQDSRHQPGQRLLQRLRAGHGVRRGQGPCREHGSRPGTRAKARSTRSARKPPPGICSSTTAATTWSRSPSCPRSSSISTSISKTARSIHSTYEDFAERVLAEKPELKTYNGELHSGKYHPLLPGVFSARMYIKQANERTQTLLEKWAEPACAFAWLNGGTLRPQLLWEAWKLLIKNHPHDSICGCTIDQVHREMMPRFEQSQQIGEVLTGESLRFTRRQG